MLEIQSLACGPGKKIKKTLKLRRMDSMIMDESRGINGACAHYVVMVSKLRWKPFWLPTQRDPQDDWTGWQNRVNYEVFAQAPSLIRDVLGS